MKLHILAIFLFSTLPSLALAATNTQPTTDLCPDPTQLVKKDMSWGAPDGWISYNHSQDDHVVGFVKAQWVGVNIGKVICIYQGNKKYSFPIALEQQYDKPVPSPTGGRWYNEKNGRKMCLSNNIKDCPFTFVKPSAPKNPYDEIDFFKNKKGSN